ncbi:MAG: hypothetical protein CMI54_07805 [Parcubacteria group bacterium]|jgi:Arc/MetJ-type ribon-helix-helix transcriptional regulator|nr:hypothetical protein [Parcubacteria group bacterium]|tara:strand:+ start:1361 stop:1660 length:300 start_codon:yes stop_codon:yes gene_type:complete
MKMKFTKGVYVRVNKEMLSDIKDIVDGDKYSSVAHFLRCAANRLLQSEGRKGIEVPGREIVMPRTAASHEAMSEEEFNKKSDQFNQLEPGVSINKKTRR